MSRRLSSIPSPAAGRAAWCLAALAAITGVYCAHIYLGLGGESTDAAFDDVAYNVVMLGAAVTLCAHALTRRRDRAPLLLIGAGMLSWALGDLYYTILYGGQSEPPTPSFDDALYLLYYPLLCTGIGLLLARRAKRIRATMWLDGAIAGLGMCAVAAGLVLDPVLGATGGSLPVVATNLAYPVGDLLLLLLVITAIGLTGWRPGLVWGLLALSLLVQVSADTVYLFQVATDAYVENSWLEPLWPLASLLMLAATLRPARSVRVARDDGWRSLAAPVLGATAAVVLLYVDRGHIEVNLPGRLLALATLAAAALRVALAFRQSLRRQRESHTLAVTDALTGLWNRRMLVEDLEEALHRATPQRSCLLVLYDLNGFKLYNDSFGHPAGDSLLARLAGKLAVTAAPFGRAYRMGGDEFCALLWPGELPVEALVAATAAALSESGHGFEITAAYGFSMLPLDARDASTALQIADRRLYAHKESRPAGVKHQLRGVLLEILGARLPTLADHLDGVAALAFAVGRRMRLEPEAIDELVRAAEMHDVGKTAIPEAILAKSGPLDESEWAFMRRHTIFGERILAAAPALKPVARLVRSSHERWDGKGYPDGLAGSDIPIGSRIIFACDAFDAITSERPYHEPRSEQEALAELRRCAGSQFDTDVVAALCAIVEEGRDHGGAVQGRSATADVARVPG